MIENDYHLGYRDEAGNPTDPNPNQAEAERLFFDENVDGVLLEGGQNSGKTLAAVKIGIIETMLRYPGIDIGIGHVSYGALEGSLVAKIKHLLDRTVILEDGTPHKLMVYRTGKRDITITIPDKRYIHPDKGYTAYIKCIPLDPKKGLDELLNIIGVQFGVFIWDQAEWMRDTGRRVWTAIVARTRVAPQKVIMTANPEVDAWFEDIFLNPSSQNFDRLRCVVMNPADNAYKDKDYMARMRRTWNERDAERYLEGKSVSLRRKILDYNWSYGFDTWHKIPDGYEVWGIFDFGQRDPTVYQLWAVSPTGHVYLFASLKIMGDDSEIQSVADSVNEMTHTWLFKGRQLGEPVPTFRIIRCDPSLVSRKDTNRKSQIQLFKEAGLSMQPAPIIGRNKEGQIKTEITILKNLHDQGKLHICFDQEDWRKEEDSWTWAKSGKDEPGDWRKYGADGETVIHHFDHMACTRYFAASYKQALGDFDVDMPRKPIEASYDNDIYTDIGERSRADDDLSYITKLIYGH